MNVGEKVYHKQVGKKCLGIIKNKYTCDLPNICFCKKFHYDIITDDGLTTWFDVNLRLIEKKSIHICGLICDCDAKKAITF